MWHELPPNAQAYLERISELAGRVRICMVGVGPHRDHTLTVDVQHSEVA